MERSRRLARQDRPRSDARPAPGPPHPTLLRALHAAGNRATGRFLQRRLLAEGDVERFKRMAEPGAGMQLTHNPLTREVSAVLDLDVTPRSNSFSSQLLKIIGDPVQDAEIRVGQGQRRVLAGAFPATRDLTGERVQRVDMDDIEKLEVDTPGMGLAALAHELQENYFAHGITPVPGRSQFIPSHTSAIEAENAVLAETFGPGGRVCDRDSARPGAEPGDFVRVNDYEGYFLVIDVDAQTGENLVVRSSRRVGRRRVSRYVIDGYASGSTTAPGSGYKHMWAAQRDLRTHPFAMAWVEGFTDETGTEEVNRDISLRRARGVRDVLKAGTGLEDRNFNTQGRGETDFVAANDDEAGRRRNRRVVITIDEPESV